MEPQPDRQPKPIAVLAVIRMAFQFLASLQLAVVLIAVLAVILALATFLESAQNREYVQWYVYKADWFLVLLGLLGVSVLAAMAARFPWKWRQSWFLLTHVGLLVLLAGAAWTFTSGVEGQVQVQEGETADQMMVTERSQIRVSTPKGAGRGMAFFMFSPGAVDWPEGKTLDLGEQLGLSVRMLKFYRYARAREEWIAADDRDAKPVVQFKFLGPEGRTLAERWLVGGSYEDGEVELGPATFELHRAAVDSLREDFVKSPDMAKAPDGVLSVHYDGKTQQLPVRENVGKKVALAGSKVEVEISRYLPDARPGTNDRFASVSDKPNNPVVELKVHVPGQAQPLQQKAFAKHPLLSFDGIHGVTYPVKLWYHHPAVKPSPGIMFLQTSDGKLYARTTSGETTKVVGEVQQGDRLDVTSQFKLEVLKYLPRARKKVTFHPVQLPRGENSGPEAAALVEVRWRDSTAEAWLQRNDAQYGFRQASTPDGPIGIDFGYELAPLGFGLKLQKFRHELNPGMMGSAAFSSTVQVVDAEGISGPVHVISMNEPLVQGRYTFYQTDFREIGNDRNISIFSVAYDPGRTLKYLGSLMICLGACGMFFRRFVPICRNVAAPSEAGGKASPPSKAVKSAVLTAAVLFLGLAHSAALGEQKEPAAAKSSADSSAAKTAPTQPTLVVAPADGNYDWHPWRQLAVQDGGRQKPLDTLAWETVRSVSNQAGLTDPETGQELDAVAAYLTILLSTPPVSQVEAQGRHGMMSPSSPLGNRQFDKWDRAPLLLVDDLELRKAIGLDKNQKRISPEELGRAKITDPDTGVSSPFTSWAENVMRRQRKGLTRLESQAADLAQRLFAYVEHRSGNALEIIPVEDSKKQVWLTLAQLLAVKLDEKGDDPTGQLRAVRDAYLRVKAAFLAGKAAEFNAASATFINTLHEIGRQRGNYPSDEVIRWEVRYNHWAPFRFAWMLSLAALLTTLLSMRTGWRPFYVTAVGAFSLSIVAMLVGFAMRVAISSRAPVTNMYESVVYVGLGTALFGLIFELIYRKKFVLMAAAAVATVALLLAANAPAHLDPSLRPLQPVLRSNFWLALHVLTVTLSYAAFALAMGIADIQLGFHLVRPRDKQTIDALAKFVYSALMVGVLLLAIGTVTGAIWADYAWGRFWGWDPKEVWALVALLVYLALLHARFIVGCIGNFGLAAWSVVCFTCVVMAWYGVNFVLGAGLHSYGFGGGGLFYVAAALGLQVLYVIVAAMVDAARSGAE